MKLFGNFFRKKQPLNDKLFLISEDIRASGLACTTGFTIIYKPEPVFNSHVPEIEQNTVDYYLNQINPN